MSTLQMPGLQHKSTSKLGSIRRRDLRRFWRKYDLALLGGAFFGMVLICTVFAPLLTPYDPVAMSVSERFQPPSLLHLFGTDDFGRDVLARVLYGGRTILVSGFVSVIVAMLTGNLIGIFSGYVRGWPDELFMRLMDVMLSFPSVLLAILIVAALGVGLTNTIIAIVFFMVPVFARLARSVVISLAQEDYVLAARSLGATNPWIIRAHILPNMLPLVIVQGTGMLAIAISTATALNFLGLGVEPPTPDWGLMVADGQRLLFDAAHVPFFPGIVITLTVLSINFVGDGLRDHLDPRLRGRL